MSIKPCLSESDYMMGTTIASTASLSYMPRCLKVKAGTAVKFTGDFSMHPLKPSAKRGSTTDNPIKDTSTGMEATFTFAKAGYYAYFCNFHGPGDDGSFMAGVVWVTP
jgi:plastocyanin